jgi:DNA-binding response OmpR family regulator
VDNVDAIRDIMIATLLRKGFEVIAATTVTEALKLITTETFDLLA